jgi:hypothetical protein
MATCDLSAGRLEPCKDSIGGLKKVFFLNSGFTTVEDVEDMITDINDGATTPGAVTLYQYDLKDASNMEETITSSRETGTTFFEQVVNLVLKKLDNTTRKEVKMMAYGMPALILWDNNDNLLLVGKERGTDVTGGSITTGTALGDLSGYTIALTGREKEPANFVTFGTDKTDPNYPFDSLTTPPTIVVGS